MRSALALSLCLAALASPAMARVEPPQRGADGYYFGKAEHRNLEPEIVFVVHRSLDDLRAAVPDATAAEVKRAVRDLYAWSALQGERCTVHIVDPRVSYQPEWIGHEITHCIFGRWHK